MMNSIETLLTQINYLIKPNNKNEITGAILNKVLRDMVETVSQPYFLVPKSVDLNESHLGKIVMNDENGLAKLYSYSPASNESLGKWKLQCDEIDEINENASLDIEVKGNGYSVSRNTWRNGELPTNTLEDLTLLSNYINDRADVFFLNATVSNNSTLEIEEVSQKGVSIKGYNFPNGSFVQEESSAPALPAAPTAHPLGRLIGIKGDSAMIGSSNVEVYSTNEPININYEYFNLASKLNPSDEIAITEDILKFIIIPNETGGVRHLTKSDLTPVGQETLDKINISYFRHQILGIAVYSNNTSVTIYKSNFISIILGVLVNFYRNSINIIEN